jgi:predicted NACHT family NTPase
MEELKRNRPVSRFKATIKSFSSKATGSNLAEIQSWLVKPIEIERLHRNLKKEQEIATLLSPETPKKLNSFFYPLKVIASSTQKPTALKNLVKVNGTHGILINGRLGQGKSILLRYLQFLELNNGTTIPLFVELRKVKNASSLLEKCNNSLKNLGLSCSDKLFNFLLAEGFVSLFFDGYDEIPLDHRDSFNEEFSRICLNYPKIKVLVTSRENTEITTKKHFKNYDIAPLHRNELPLYIIRILGKEEIYAPILKK